MSWLPMRRLGKLAVCLEITAALRSCSGFQPYPRGVPSHGVNSEGCWQHVGRCQSRQPGVKGQRRSFLCDRIDLTSPPPADGFYLPAEDRGLGKRRIYFSVPFPHCSSGEIYGEPARRRMEAARNRNTTQREEKKWRCVGS